MSRWKGVIEKGSLLRGGNSRVRREPGLDFDFQVVADMNLHFLNDTLDEIMNLLWYPPGTNGTTIGPAGTIVLFYPLPGVPSM